MQNLVVRQKGKSQSSGYKKIKQAKFSEKLPSDTFTVTISHCFQQIFPVLNCGYITTWTYFPVTY